MNETTHSAGQNGHEEGSEAHSLKKTPRSTDGAKTLKLDALIREDRRRASEGTSPRNQVNVLNSNGSTNDLGSPRVTVVGEALLAMKIDTYGGGVDHDGVPIPTQEKGGGTTPRGVMVNLGGAVVTEAPQGTFKSRQRRASSAVSSISRQSGASHVSGRQSGDDGTLHGEFKFTKSEAQLGTFSKPGFVTIDDKYVDPKGEDIFCEKRARGRQMATGNVLHQQMKSLQRDHIHLNAEENKLAAATINQKPTYNEKDLEDFVLELNAGINSNDGQIPAHLLPILENWKNLFDEVSAEQKRNKTKTTLTVHAMSLADTPARAVSPAPSPRTPVNQKLKPAIAELESITSSDLFNIQTMDDFHPSTFSVLHHAAVVLRASEDHYLLEDAVSRSGTPICEDPSFERDEPTPVEAVEYICGLLRKPARFLRRIKAVEWSEVPSGVVANFRDAMRSEKTLASANIMSIPKGCPEGLLVRALYKWLVLGSELHLRKQSDESTVWDSESEGSSCSNRLTPAYWMIWSNSKIMGRVMSFLESKDVMNVGKANRMLRIHALTRMIETWEIDAAILEAEEMASIDSSSNYMETTVERTKNLVNAKTCASFQKEMRKLRNMTTSHIRVMQVLCIMSNRGYQHERPEALLSDQIGLKEIVHLKGLTCIPVKRLRHLMSPSAIKYEDLACTPSAQNMILWARTLYHNHIQQCAACRLNEAVSRLDEIREKISKASLTIRTLRRSLRQLSLHNGSRKDRRSPRRSGASFTSVESEMSYSSSADLSPRRSSGLSPSMSGMPGIGDMSPKSRDILMRELQILEHSKI